MDFYKTNRYWSTTFHLLKMIFIGCCIAGAFVETVNAQTGAGSTQNCDVGPGNIISNQTFGAGKMGALPATYITYTYLPDGCPNDGFYTVADSVNGTCFTNSWHSVREDHTPGDVKGNMLLINAPYPGEIYRETITGLCTKANYNYSFWLLNINLIFPKGTCGFEIPNDPDITIRIELPDGRLIGTVTTGVITRTQAPVWRQFALNFSIPTMPEEITDVVVKLIDNGEGGCGNDFVIDDLVLKRCTDCESPSVFVPDAFTPNNDGTNDVLDIYTSNVSAFEFVVYNRWGSAVFVSRDPAVKWDGKFKGVACPEGVYTWSMSYEFTGSPQKYTKNGQVTLLH
ncbi:gliding motility-associated C-terminal domain-containing protein [Runella sp.]|uniref:T9SS type B sorting domain-containing protein n=1 Tax=Runella sp. TaxID=1960881 RepID=UPI003D119172